jgi:hypothetical protein
MGLNESDITAGIGLKFERFNVDYAYKDSDIGGEHRISSTMKFGVHPDAEAEPVISKHHKKGVLKNSYPESQDYHNMISRISSIKKKTNNLSKAEISTEELEIVAERLGYKCEKDKDTNVVEFSDGESSVLIINGN